MFLWQKGSHARFCSRSRTALPEFVATARSRTTTSNKFQV